MERNMQMLAMDVRAADYDRFLAIQLAPATRRHALYAVTAFHGELARIAETVSEPMLGHIRLAWWREALEEIINGAMPRQHPVVQELAALYAQTPALFTPLLAMIEARAMDLDESLLTEQAGWTAYLDGTAGALHYAWALLLDPAYAAANEAAIRREARGYAIIGLLRAIPYMHANGFLRFPSAPLLQWEVVALAPSSNVSAFAEMLANTAERELQGSAWPREMLALKGLAGLARLHLRQLKTHGFNPYALPLAKLRAAWTMVQLKYF